MKRSLLFILIILTLLTSCSGEIGDLIASMNTNVFLKNKLTETEKKILKESLTVETLTPSIDGQLASRTKTITVLDGSKVDIKIRYAQSIDGSDIQMLEIIPNDIRKALSVIFNNEAKSDDIKAYLASKPEGVTDKTLDSCANSILRIIDKSIGELNFDNIQDGDKIKQTIDEVIAHIKEDIATMFTELRKGDVLAISVLSSSLNNIIAKVGAQAIALGAWSGMEFDVFSFNWATLLSGENSEKYFLALIDALAHELAILDAILPHCGAFINFDIKAIAESFLGGN